MKIREIHIKDYKIFKDFKIDFTDNGKPLDIVVLAGINGSGKSSLLGFIDKPKSSFMANRMIGESIDLENGKLEELTIFENKFTIGHPESNRPAFEKRCNKIKGNVKYYKSCEVDINYSRSAIIKYIDKLIYEKDKKSSEVYEIVREKVNNLFADFDLQIEFNLLDKDRNIFFKNEKSERIPISQLSGGEKELITKAFTLYVSDIKNKIILIDEPESSLHPKLAKPHFKNL